METNVKVNISLVIPIKHGDGAVDTFLEKLAKDSVSDILHSAEQKIDIQSIAGIAIEKLPADVQKFIDEEEENKYHNYYRCDDCNEEWEDDHSCMCDDQCPKCEKPHSPYKSEDNY